MTLTVRELSSECALVDHALLAYAVAAFQDVPDGDADIALSIGPCVRLWCFAPAAIPDQSDGSNARAVVLAVLRNAAENAQAHLGVSARQ